MKERPILFKAPMVRAILSGEKTQTRRVVKPQPELAPTVACAYGAVGYRLWVRETFMLRNAGKSAVFKAGMDADEAAGFGAMYGGWKSPIFMPRWASRITLEITGVRVERLQDISENDATAEGCHARLSGTWWHGYRQLEDDDDLFYQQAMGDAPPEWMIEPRKMKPTPHFDRSAKKIFELLWHTINAKTAPWDSNPWVWVVEFVNVKKDN